MPTARLLACLVYFLAIPGLLLSAEPALPERQLQFFETRIRPVLVDTCYECHNSAGKKEGGLALDTRAGLLTGGDRGPAIEVGRGKQSLLVAALEHTDDLRMPSGGPKLKPAVIADFIRWIDDGAIDPRDKPPTAAEVARLTSWEQQLARRRQWWSFQPPREQAVPSVADPRWNRSAIDRWIFQRSSAARIEPAPRADRATLLRRLSFVLTGLPPTHEELAKFIADDSVHSFENAVDRLLSSPRFGERWARHWMDWLRYAESHGSEGDPAIPNAWRYRDYLIRAWNQDVPYHQLVREHLAGDLLPEPRVNGELGIVEAKLGLGHFRMVQHGYAPTDALEDKVRVIDNQIDVISKAFLGVTLSCARCHNHKFDPLSQADFYGWYGILAGCRPASIMVDSPAKLHEHDARLLELKKEIREQLATAWSRELKRWPEYVSRSSGIEQAPADAQPFLKTWRDELAKIKEADSTHPLSPFAAITKSDNDQISTWTAWRNKQRDLDRQRDQFASHAYRLRWNLATNDYAKWHRQGNGLGNEPAQAGAFDVLPNGERIIGHIHPAGVMTHLVSSKQGGVLTSPRFKIETDEIWVRAAGKNNARVRYVVQNYPRVILIYPHSQLETETGKWFQWDARYWKGEEAHIEWVTGDDQPIDVKSDNGRSWFAAFEAIGVNRDDPRPVEMKSVAAVLYEGNEIPAVATANELMERYRDALTRCVEHWRRDECTDNEAEFLAYFVRQGLLSNQLTKLPEIVKTVDAYRDLEQQVIVPTRAPGLVEGDPVDQPLYVRGNHKQPSEAVPRHFLDALDAEPITSSHSGRLEWATKLTDARNPLFARVIVNRLWHHVFGRGLVSTTDNFGRMGEEPTHTELLDHLALRFSGQAADRGIQPWSLKSLIRELVLSEAFQQSCLPTATGREQDPENRLWSRYPVRRLEAEAIRDSMLALSGQLDSTMFGPSVASNAPRRSLYLQVHRNNLDPFLTVFDSPEPTTTWGRRDTTNVPAQSLALLNDGFLAGLASRWADRVLAESSLATDDQKIRRLLSEAAGREPTPREVELATGFLQTQDARGIELEAEANRMQEDIKQLRGKIAAILQGARSRTTTQPATPAQPAGPTPLAEWKFNGDLRDSVGSLHALPHQPNQKPTEPIFRSGAVVLDGKTYLTTEPLSRELTEKTLEVWLRLDTLQQRAGGAMTVETNDGGVFDSLVFAEQEPGRWMSGSNFFSRTASVGGPAEQEATNEVVHLAATYAADGTIALYRNSEPYGQPYKVKELARFPGGQSRVMFGLRHFPPGSGKYLSGELHLARLYDRALTREEIKQSARAQSDVVAQATLLSLLNQEERAQYDDLLRQIETREESWRKLRLPEPAGPNPRRKWHDLARSLFSWKAFLYLH